MDCIGGGEGAVRRTYSCGFSWRWKGRGAVNIFLWIFMLVKGRGEVNILYGISLARDGAGWREHTFVDIFGGVDEGAT